MGAAGDTIEVETRYGRMWALRGDRYITGCLAAYGAYSEAEADIFRRPAAGADRADRCARHVAPLATEGAFKGETGSLNMLCLPKELAMTVTDLERIDPANWRSPVRPLGAK